MPFFETDPRNIDDRNSWSAPILSSRDSRRGGSSAVPRKSFTISITMNAFIPRNLGQVIHGMGAVDSDVRGVNWGFEPHQCGLGTRYYMFATDSRSFAVEAGSSRVSLNGRLDAARIGTLAMSGALFDAPRAESFQIQADVTNSLLGLR